MLRMVHIITQESLWFVHTEPHPVGGSRGQRYLQLEVQTNPSYLLPNPTPSLVSATGGSAATFHPLCACRGGELSGWERSRECRLVLGVWSRPLGLGVQLGLRIRKGVERYSQASCFSHFWWEGPEVLLHRSITIYYVQADRATLAITLPHRH